MKKPTLASLQAQIEARSAMNPGDVVHFVHRAQLLKGFLRKLKKNGAWMVNVPGHDDECACGAVVFDVFPSNFRDATGKEGAP